MKTEKRKDLHLKTAMKKESQFRKTSLFEEIELIHNPLLDCELTEIKTQTTFLGKKFSFPLCIRPITGGTKKSFELNKNIALACEKKGIGFALGSMRAGLENKSKIEFFKLNSKDSKIKAAGAGATEMFTKLSTKNVIEIGKWFKRKQKIVLFDLVHVNQALTSHQAMPVDGIIGADILKKGRAIIDYQKTRLYLKQ